MKEPKNLMKGAERMARMTDCTGQMDDQITKLLSKLSRFEGKRD